MSIRFQERRGFRTTGNSPIFAGQTRASAFLMLRIGVDCNPSGNYFFAGRAGGAGWLVQRAYRADANHVRVKFAWVNGASKQSYVMVDLAKGSAYAIAMTLDGSVARTYINNQPYVMPAFAGPTAAVGTWFGINHDTGVTSGQDHEIADLAAWNDYVLTPQQIADLTTGAVSPAEIMGGSARWYWPFGGLVSQSVTATDAGLVDVVSGLALGTAIENGGAATYTEPLTFAPEAQIDEAWITTSGRLLCATFKSISTGLATLPKSCNTPPTLKINGVDVGQTSVLVASNNQPYVAFLLPPSSRVSDLDAVTASAPTAWMATGAGVAEPVVNIEVANKVGKSCHRGDDFVKTLRMGVNMEGGLTTAGASGPEFANLQIRLAEWSGQNIAEYDENWKPIRFTEPNTTATAKLYANDGPTGIDETGYPGMTGLIAVGFNDTEPGVPTYQWLKSGNKTTTVVVERTEYNNPGVLGEDGVLRGIVRVFEVSRHPDSTTYETHITYVLQNAAGRPRFENLFILHEDDFTPGYPTVLDTSDRYRISARTADQFRGAGSIRSWTPFTAGVRSIMWEKEHLRPIDDFCWSYYKHRKSYPVRYTKAEPFSIEDTPYIYWTTFEGDRYTAHLDVGCSATDTTLTITTLPGQGNELIIGSRLFLGDEWIRVDAVEMNGLVATCTVTRGDNGTEPVAHDPGPIEVGWRTRMIQPGGNASTSYWYHGYFVKLTTQEPHGLCSGMVLDASGSWPTFTYADGRTGKISGLVYAPVVTGPNTLVCNVAPWYDITDPAQCTIPEPMDLDPSQCVSLIKIPNQATLPYAAHCKIANQLDCPRVFFALPNYGTRGQWRFAAEQIRDNLDPGRISWIEIGNEDWGFWEMKQPGQLFSTAFHPGETLWAAHLNQHRIAREVFDDVFGDRKDEVKFFLNLQWVNPDPTPLIYAASQNPPIRIDGVATAPYIGNSTNNLPAEVLTAINSLEVDEAIDLWIHSLCRCETAGPLKWGRAWRAVLDDYTAATGFPTEYLAYEGCSIGVVHSNTVENFREREHDFTYHPNMYIAIQDLWAVLQTTGTTWANYFAAYMQWGDTRYAWGMYKGYMQDYGRGDGSDGKANNLNCLAVPGKPKSKLPTTSQDFENVSVFGAAFRDWNRDFLPPSPKSQQKTRGGLGPARRRVTA